MFRDREYKRNYKESCNFNFAKINNSYHIQFTLTIVDQPLIIPSLNCLHRRWIFFSFTKLPGRILRMIKNRGNRRGDVTMLAMPHNSPIQREIVLFNFSDLRYNMLRNRQMPHTLSHANAYPNKELFLTNSPYF